MPHEALKGFGGLGGDLEAAAVEGTRISQNEKNKMIIEGFER
jgi:hypothetical protein